MAIASSKSGLSKTVVVVILVAVIILASVAAASIAFKPPSGSPGSKSSPTPTPTTSPTSTPKASPTSSPPATPHSTPNPTAAPTTQPTTAPTSAPTPSPTPAPTATPAPTPTPSPGNTHTVDYTAMMTGNEQDNWDLSETQPYTLLLDDKMTVSSGDQWLQISGLSSGSTVWSVTFINSTTYQVRGNSSFFQCTNGLVYVIVSSNSITIEGSTQYVTSTPFQSISQVRTVNGDGNFNGGELVMTLTT